MAWKKQDPDIARDSTQWGGSLKCSIDQKQKKVCEPWERELCLEIRIDNEPETMITENPNLLRCPRCKFEIQLEPQEETK